MVIPHVTQCIEVNLTSATDVFAFLFVYLLISLH